MTVGSTLFLVLSDQSPVWWLAINLSVLGFSNGFNNVGLQTALFQVSPQEIISAASGLFQTARYMGTILSTVLLGVLFWKPSVHQWSPLGHCARGTRFVCNLDELAFAQETPDTIARFLHSWHSFIFASVSYSHSHLQIVYREPVHSALAPIALTTCLVRTYTELSS